MGQQDNLFTDVEHPGVLQSCRLEICEVKRLWFALQNKAEIDCVRPRFVYVTQQLQYATCYPQHVLHKAAT